MEQQLELSEISASELRGKLKHWEERRNSLLAAFPYLVDGSVSLTARYAGGPEWNNFAEAMLEIKKLKLELISRGEALRPPEEQRGPLSADLTQRERKIWDVISRGPKGLEYCRELHNAGLKPRRSKSWAGCPGTYPAAYQGGNPWRHRIQDEKSKIRRKAKLAGLAGE
jgi:hypothetical protein